MSEDPFLPTFFIIGAAKAGTVSLNNYLAAHPEIAMAEPREPHLMVAPDWREKVNEYSRYFVRDAPLRGDCSPRYSTYPFNPHVSERIAELVPDARLIFLVRDPVERTIACYAQGVTHGRQHRPLEVAVRPEDPDNYYIAGSSYARQVEVYMRRFDRDRLLIIDQADLREDRRETLRRAFEHVGADPEFWSDEFAVEHNVRGADNVGLGRLGKRLRDSDLNRLSRRLLPGRRRRRLVSATRRVFGKGASYPEVSPEFRARIAEALAPDADRLRRITGRPFSGWSV